MITRNRTRSVLALGVLAMALLGSVVNGGVVGLIGDDTITTTPYYSFTKAEYLLGLTDDAFAYDPSDPTSDLPADFDEAQPTAFVGTNVELAVIAYDLDGTYGDIFIDLYGRRSCCPGRDNYFDVELWLGGVLQEAIAGSIDGTYHDRVTASPGTQADSIRFVETAAVPKYFTLIEVRVNGEDISVNAGVDMITWSGQGVDLVPTYDLGYTPTSWTWSADPAADVVFTPNANAEAPMVTITKATDNPSVITVTLTADDGISPVVNTMQIDVYDDPCLAAIGKDPVAAVDSTDFDGNCITGLEDFAVVALAWFYDYSLLGPEPK